MPSWVPFSMCLLVELVDAMIMGSRSGSFEDLKGLIILTSGYVSPLPVFCLPPCAVWKEINTQQVMGNMMKWVCVEFPSSEPSGSSPSIAFTDPVTLF